MARSDRETLIKEIEAKRESKVLCYIAGDRKGLETKLATDTFPFIYEHLSKIGETDAIDLLLYTTGGVTIAGWGLVNLIREFCNKFSLLVPYKALSAGTLISLGADEIIMGKLGQLSPVDPSVHSPFNPTAPGQPEGRFLPVNVEDVIGYLNLAKDEAGLTGEGELNTVFDKLSEKVHPLALGGVYRAREQIKMLSRKLLISHMRDPSQVGDVENIIKTLTEDLLSHDYIINRDEAKNQIKLNVIDIDDDLDSLIWELYHDYEKEMDLTIPYNPELALGTENQTTVTFDRAFIESLSLSSVFQTVKELRRVVTQRPGDPVQVHGFEERLLREGWIRHAD